MANRFGRSRRSGSRSRRSKKPVRFLLISGKPLKEPVAWYGPIVMNTKEELQTAFQEFQQGAFIKAGAELSRK